MSQCRRQLVLRSRSGARRDNLHLCADGIASKLQPRRGRYDSPGHKPKASPSREAAQECSPGRKPWVSSRKRNPVPLGTTETPTIPSRIGIPSRNISSLAVKYIRAQIQSITQQGRLEGGASGYWTTPVTRSSGFQQLRVPSPSDVTRTLMTLARFHGICPHSRAALLAAKRRKNAAQGASPGHVPKNGTKSRKGRQKLQQFLPVSASRLEIFRLWP